MQSRTDRNDFVDSSVPGQDPASLFLMRLNRSHIANKIDHFVHDELRIVLNHFERNEDKKCGILYGAGGIFSGGYPFCSTESTEEKIRRIRQTEKIPESSSCPKPIIVAVEGPCQNGGLEMALNGDRIIAAEDTIFNVLRCHINLPLVDEGSRVLANIIGVEKMAELIESGRLFDAEEAKQMGIVHRVVPNDQLKRETYKEAFGVLRKSPLDLNLNSPYRNLYGLSQETPAIYSIPEHCDLM